MPCTDTTRGPCRAVRAAPALYNTHTHTHHTHKHTHKQTHAGLKVGGEESGQLLRVLNQRIRRVNRRAPLCCEVAEHGAVRREHRIRAPRDLKDAPQQLLKTHVSIGQHTSASAYDRIGAPRDLKDAPQQLLTERVDEALVSHSLPHELLAYEALRWRMRPYLKERVDEALVSLAHKPVLKDALRFMQPKQHHRQRLTARSSRKRTDALEHLSIRQQTSADVSRRQHAAHCRQQTEAKRWPQTPWPGRGGSRRKH